MSGNKPAWYSQEGGLFDADYLEEYAAVISPERTRQEVQFIVDVLQLRPGMRVLDLACGHGRHAIALAKLGLSMVGQDLNEFFLHQAREASQTAGVKIEWIKRDMREISFTNEFDMVINMFTAFGYLEDDNEDQEVLKQVSQALKSGGCFLIDVINREWLMRNYGTHSEEDLPNGSRIVIDRHYDFSSGRNYERRVRTWPDDKSKDVRLIHRLYAAHELVNMCQKAGLKYKKAFGYYDSSPLTLDSKHCILVAAKN